MDNVARGEKARRIARSYVGWAVGAGLIPFPLADVGSLVVLQVKMLTEIARVYEVPLERERARTLVMSTVGGLAPQGVALIGVPALLKFIPVLGTLLGIAVMPAAAASSTVALAEIFIRHIETFGRVPDRAWPQVTHSQDAPPALVAAPVVAGFAVDEPAVVAEATGGVPGEKSAAGDAQVADAVEADGGPAPMVSAPESVDGRPAPTMTTEGLDPVPDDTVVSGRGLTEEPDATREPAVAEEPAVTEEPVAAGDGHADPSGQEEADDGAEAADPAPGVDAERPVRRRRSKARTRRRASPTETA